MRTLIYTLLFFTLSYSKLKAQNPDEKKETHTYVEVMPEYPGGEAAMLRFISQNVQYPIKAIENDIQGKVLIGFVVDENGELTEFRIVKGIGYGCDEEAIRVLKLMPTWKPGMQNGKNVRVSYLIPIKFSIQDDKPKKKKKGRG